MLRFVFVRFASALVIAAPTVVLLAPPAVSADPCVVSDKLVNPCRPWVGAAVDNYGLGGLRANILNHEQRAGRQVEIVHDYLQPNDRIDSDQRFFVNRANTILLLNWKPVSNWSQAAGGSSTTNTYIDRMADDINALGDKKIMLNLFHEPEDNVSSGGAPGCGTKVLRGNAGSTASYRAMWHNVRARFDAKGVDNVVWVMNYMGWTNWYCMTRDLWPGNDYVDWLMFDPYPNTGNTWRTFINSWNNHLVSQTTATHAFTSKPWGIAEYGYKGTSQTEAYQMYADLRANVDFFSRIKAYVVWDNVNTGADLDHRVVYNWNGVHDPNEQTAYNTLVRDPLFNQPWTYTPDGTPPSTPGGLSASAGSASISLSWTASTDNVGVTGYVVRRDGSLLITTPSTSYVDSTAQQGVTHSYTVTARDAAGNESTPAGPVSAMVPAPVPDTEPPSAPSGLTATNLQGLETDVGLSWTAATDNVGVATYTVVRDSLPLATVAGTSTSYVDTTTEPNTTYSYTVFASDAKGNAGPPAAAVEVTTPETADPPPDATPPTAPTGLTASLQGYTVRLNWTASTDDVGVTGYTVFRGATSLGTVSGTTYLDTTPPVNATSSYTVRALDAAGRVSAPSAAVSVAVPPDTVAPSRVGTISATAGPVGSRSITITWTAATDNSRVASYWLFRQNAKYRQLPGTTLSFVDTGLTAGTTYTYKVYAIDAANLWGPSSGNVSAVAR